MSEKFTLFWGGVFSQWYPSPFKTYLNLDYDVPSDSLKWRGFKDGYPPQPDIWVTYTCCEQWMMAHKAMMFGDQASLEKIMATDDPRKQKKIGRSVKNFDPAIWSKHARNIVYYGNWHKFMQNPVLLGHLYQTHGTTLVEASPYDKIWGIGLGEDRPEALFRETWRGTNWLGEVLTKLREDLLEDLPGIPAFKGIEVFS